MLFNPVLYGGGSSSSGVMIPWNVIEPWQFWSGHYNQSAAYAALDSATIILDHAFDQTSTNYSSSLKYAWGPECKYIGNYAFANNVSLISVYFPKCEYVGDSAFLWASRASFTFSSLKWIGSSAFYACRSMSSIIQIPSCCISIGANAFTQTYIEELYLPSGHTVGIGTAYFLNLGSGAFAETKLQKIHCEANYLAERRDNRWDPEAIFANNNYLLDISFPNLYEIPPACFASCTHLTDADFPNVTTIGYRAFANCSLFAEITVPKCTVIGSSAFYSTALYGVIDFPYVYHVSSGAFQGLSLITEVIIGSQRSSLSYNSAITIESYAFQNCRSLQTATIEAAWSIGNYAFGGCSNLSSIIIGQKYFSSGANTWIGSCAFISTAIQTFSTPVTYYYMAGSVFSCCFQLSEVYLKLRPGANSSSYQLSYGFYRCSNLQTVSLVWRQSTSKSFCRLGYNAFSWCSNLRSVYIENMYSEQFAFSGCTGIKYIALSNVDQLPALDGCTYLTISLYTSSGQSITKAGITQLPRQGIESIYVNQDAYSSYINDSVWGSYAGMIYSY